MNPFSPPPGPYPTDHGPQNGFPYPTNHGPQNGFPFPTNDRPPAGMPFGTIDGPPAGMQYPTYYGSMPGMRGPTTIPPVPAPARKKRMILPVLGGGFVGAVVLAAVIALQGPERYPVPAQADLTPATNAADQVGFREAGTLSALDLQAGDCYNTGRLPPAPGTSTPISTVEAVPCASPHTDQVIAKVVYAPTDTLADVRANRAGADCEGELRQKVADATLTDPAYSSGTLVPADDTTWTAGHTIACVVMSDGPRTGSALK
jgi:hypothetical protein